MRLEHQATSLDLSASSVNAAVKGASSSSGSNQWYPNSQSSNNSSSSGYFSNCGRGLGNQQFSYGQAPRVICQVCNKLGHSAMNCCHRFDHAFQSAPRTPIQLPYLHIQQLQSEFAVKNLGELLFFFLGSKLFKPRMGYYCFNSNTFIMCSNSPTCSPPNLSRLQWLFLSH
jgi:hypothetical protein